MLLRHVIELWKEKSKIGLLIFDLVLQISLVHFITNEPIPIRSIQSTTSSVSKLTDTSLEKRKDAENINSVIKNNNINISIADILILSQILSIICRSFANHFSILSHSIVLV